MQRTINLLHFGRCSPLNMFLDPTEKYEGHLRSPSDPFRRVLLRPSNGWNRL